MTHSTTLIAVICLTVLFGSLDARDRMTNGQYPKRGGSLEIIQPAEDDTMSDTLFRLSDVLKKLALKLESMEAATDEDDETTTIVSTPDPIKEAEQLKQALQDLKRSSSHKAGDKNSLEQLSLLPPDPKREQELLSIDEADDDKTFKRIFARWMARDMARRGD